MQRDWLTRLRSRKFLMAVAAVLFIGINDVIGRPVNPDSYWQIAGIVISWIAIEGYIDAQH